MNRKSHSGNVHVLIGFAVLYFLYHLNLKYGWYDTSLLTPLDYGFIALITWVYSQLPDVDTNSRISKYVTVAGVALIIYSFVQDEKVMGIAAATMIGLFRVIEHRTVIHSLIAAAVLAAPLWYVDPLFAVVGFLAFLAHIVSEGEFSVLFEKDIKFFK